MDHTQKHFKEEGTEHTKILGEGNTNHTKNNLGEGKHAVQKVCVGGGDTDRAKNVLGREILLNVDMRKHITKRKNINSTVMKNKLKKNNRSGTENEQNAKTINTIHS